MNRERDLQFHRHCWALCGNNYLKEALERIVHPLFTFVLIANGTPVNRYVAEEHRNIVNALRNLLEPEFSDSIRCTLSAFAGHGVAIMSQRTLAEEVVEGGASVSAEALLDVNYIDLGLPSEPRRVYGSTLLQRGAKNQV